MSYHYFFLYATIVLLVGLAFIPIKWPSSRHLTFSQHVAKRKTAILYYIVLFSIALPQLVLFFVGYFTHAIRASAWLNVCILVSAVTQYICTYIPEVGGRKSTIHRTLAGASGVALLPALVLIMLSDVSMPSLLLCTASLAMMLGCIGLTVTAKGAPRNALVLQAVYFAGFFIPVLFIAYL